MSLWFQDIRRAFNVMKEVAVDLEKANQFEKVFSLFFIYFKKFRSIENGLEVFYLFIFKILFLSS